MTGRLLRLRPAATVLAAAMALGGCALGNVQAPVTFKSDHRLHLERPADEAETRLPVRLSWRVSDFQLGGGNQFAVFVDRAPVSSGKVLRMRACTEKEQTAIQPGEDRRPCHDDRKRVFTTTALSLEVPCLLPKDSAPRRVRNRHTVTVVLLDAAGRRVGQAASSRTFEVVDDDALQACRGITTKLR